MCVSPVYSALFWTNYADPRFIESADLDGTSPVRVIPHSLIAPRCLTLDARTRTLYWADVSADGGQTSRVEAAK